MPNFPRTDLAVEAEALRSAAAAAQLPGVRAEQTQRRGFAVTQVEVLDAAGSEALCKPIGRYDTLDLTPLLRRADDAFENAAQTLSELLRAALPLMPEASVLVVGLGNRAITPDAVGPDAMQSVLVTRHLRAQLPEQFGRFRSVAALTPGVLGTTGVESAELVRAMTDRLRPDAVIVVDALDRPPALRLGCTVQLTDPGITPGSGVGNDRAGLDRTTLGVPVAAIGLPTVIDAGSLTDDPRAERMFVTPRDIDAVVRDAAKLIGYGIDLALHDGLTVADLDLLLS